MPSMLVGGAAGAVQLGRSRRARGLLDKAAEPRVVLMRRDLFKALAEGRHRHGSAASPTASAQALGQSACPPAPRAATCRTPGVRAPLSLVDDDTIEREILSSRLALAMMDRASWEFTDLRSRMRVAREARRARCRTTCCAPHVLARIVAGRLAPLGLSLDGWRELQTVLHDELRISSKRPTTRPTAG